MGSPRPEVNHGDEPSAVSTRACRWPSSWTATGPTGSAKRRWSPSRWPQGFACPVCGGPASCSFRRQGRLYWQCASCRHQCSVISGTIFESTKLPLTRWFLAMHLLTQAKNNVSALELKRHLGVSLPDRLAGQAQAAWR